MDNTIKNYSYGNSYTVTAPGNGYSANLINNSIQNNSIYYKKINFGFLFSDSAGVSKPYNYIRVELNYSINYISSFPNFSQRTFLWNYYQNSEIYDIYITARSLITWTFTLYSTTLANDVITAYINFDYYYTDQN